MHGHIYAAPHLYVCVFQVSHSHRTGYNEFMRSSITESTMGWKQAECMNTADLHRCGTGPEYRKEYTFHSTRTHDGRKHTLHTNSHFTRLFPFTGEVVAKAQRERTDWLPLLITEGAHQLDWPVAFQDAFPSLSVPTTGSSSLQASPHSACLMWFPYSYFGIFLLTLQVS